MRWQVEQADKLLSEVKRRFSGAFSSHDLRWSIEHNRCFVNNRIERFASTHLKKGDTVSLSAAKAPYFEKESARIIYEDASLLVYDKPPFLPSEKLAQITSTLLIHRLDRDTSGVILLAKSREAQHHIEVQFRKRSVKKEYLAKVAGVPANKGTISGNMAPIHRREGAVMWGMSAKGVWSKTQWSLVGRQERSAWLLCQPVTGRTHQIRVHLQHIGHPIVGDYTYGYEKPQEEGVFRPLLHASNIIFTHPVSHEELHLSAAAPADFSIEIF